MYSGCIFKGAALSIIGIGAIVLVAGCQGGGTEPTAAASADQSAAPAANSDQAAPAAGAGAGAGGDSVTQLADQIFQQRCSTCHGPEGRGDGPGAQMLNPKPQNYHDKKWQASVTDDDMAKAIVYGGAAVGKSPRMASNPDLADHPDIVKALIAKVRGFGKD